MKPLHRVVKIALWVILVLLLFPIQVFAQENQIQWIEGPTTVDLGKNLADLKIGEDYLFADATETQSIMNSIGNPTDGSEIGMIVSKKEGENWFILFEYADVGFVRDDDAKDLDADAILKSIREGTEAANEERAKLGESPMKVVGWQESPHYDSTTNNLVWSVLGESTQDGQVDQTANYNVRILGRTGFVSAVMVTGPETVEKLRPQLQSILQGFSYKSGNRYAEYVQGDKLAGYGLTALVAGGVGAAAAKTGLLKGLWKLILASGKLIIALIAGLFAAISRTFKAMFGRKSTPDISS